MTALWMVTSPAPSREPENQTARKRPSRSSTTEGACTAWPGEDETNCASKRKRPSGERCCAGNPMRGAGLGAPEEGVVGDATNEEAAGRCRTFHPAKAKASISKVAARRSSAPDGLKFI